MEVNVKVVSQSKIWGVDLLMILVSLGTQDRSFHRLLDAIEKQIELGNIKTKVIVQAGVTKYESKYMEIFDLIPSSLFLQLMEECDFLICHGGVGTIIDGLKHHKKIIAAARLKEYDEHQNNHQQQIIHEFVSKNLILGLSDFDKLDEKLEEIKSFQPSQYESNLENFMALLDGQINHMVKDNQGNCLRKFMFYGFFTFFCFWLEILFGLFLQNLGCSLMEIFCYDFFLVLFYRYLMHFLFFRPKKRNRKGEVIFVFLFFIELLIFSYFRQNLVNFFFSFFLFSFLRFFFVFVVNSFFHVRDVE